MNFFFSNKSPVDVGKQNFSKEYHAENSYLPVTNHYTRFQIYIILVNFNCLFCLKLFFFFAAGEKKFPI